MNGLIGYTGFVGGNLRQQAAFDALYRSTNIAEIAGQSFDLLVCAGAPAVKWLANKEPAPDWANLQGLMAHLGTVTARQMILISTVDVYPTPVDVDEATPIDETANHAYGRHRRLLEKFVVAHFPDTLIVRLPGLFGPGLKKNIIYDFLHQNQVAAINPNSVYQFYDLNRLWADIQTAQEHGLRLVNFATAGVSVRQVARQVFEFDFENPAVAGAAAHIARYDFRTRYAADFGGVGGYLYTQEQVLAQMQAFVQATRIREQS